MSAKLVAYSAVCNNELGAIGQFESAVECGRAIESLPEICESGLFMFNSRFNTKSCRCCDRGRDWGVNQKWSIYSVRLPNRTQELRQEDYFGVIQTVDLVHGDRNWINVLPPDERSWKLDLLPPFARSKMEETATIFVAITSFQDEQCGQTLVNLFKRARYPERITVGITGYGVHCVKRMCQLIGQEKCAPLKKQILEVQTPQEARKGPDAGFRVSKSFLQQQEFCLQTHSAEDYAEGWDNGLIDDWLSAENEMAVLTTSVGDLEDMHSSEVPYNCVPSNSDNLPGIGGVSFAKDLTEPLLSTLYSSSLSFSKCHAWKTVQHDPQLPYLGSPDLPEIHDVLYGARLWTSGYDFYAPTQVFVGHNGTASSFKYVFEVQDKELRQTLARVQNLLDPSTYSQGIHAFGNKRSLTQYSKFAGYDFVHGNVSSVQACVEQARVPLITDRVVFTTTNAPQGLSFWLFATTPTVAVLMLVTLMFFSEERLKQH